MTGATSLVEPLKSLATDEGFILCGVAPAVASDGFSNLVRWIDSGFAGEMNYFDDRIEAYRHPHGVLDGAKSIIALAYPYAGAMAKPHPIGHGKIARYAWSGHDYHDTIHPKLKRICRWISDAIPDARARGVVDTAPLLEREVAQLAGLGWRGKNTLLLNKYVGSYFFLACVLTNVDLPIDTPHNADHCGTCTACMDACPTSAFPQSGVLDATRCISYLTIEHRGQIPIDLRDGMGDWLFGCDVCQEVCPWNRDRAKEPQCSMEPLEHLELAMLFELTEDQFRQRFRKTPLWRTRRRGILRNAAIVLGNQRDDRATESLLRGLNDDEPIVRGASAWALGRISGPIARDALRKRIAVESDHDVREEISRAERSIS